MFDIPFVLFESFIIPIKCSKDEQNLVLSGFIKWLYVIPLTTFAFVASALPTSSDSQSVHLPKQGMEKFEWI